MCVRACTCEPVQEPKGPEANTHSHTPSDLRNYDFFFLLLLLTTQHQDINYRLQSNADYADDAFQFCFDF